MSEPTRVQFRHWIWLAVVAATVYVLSSMYAEKSMGATRGDLGFITAGTNLCETYGISPHTIKRLATWTALVERLDAAGGAIFLSEEDYELGENLSKRCSTLAEGYPVMIFLIEDEHALVFWDKSLNFAGSPFIIRLSDFQAGGLRL